MSIGELADLAKLSISKPQGSIQTDGLWTSRSPVLLPPSPVPGQHNIPAPTQSSLLLFPRSEFGLCANESGDLYFFGGVTKGRADELYHYSTTDNTVTPLLCSGAHPGYRTNHAMALTGSVIATHGGNGMDAGLYLLNLVSREWTKVAASGDGPGVLRRHTMTVLGTTIYIFGGYDSDGTNSDKLWAFNLNAYQRLHPRRGLGHTAEPRWELIEPSSQERPVARRATTLVSYHDRLILFGGFTISTVPNLHDVWSFDPRNRRWSELQCTGDLPPPRVGHSAAILDDVMYIIGGSRDLLSLSGDHLKDVFALKVPEQRWFNLKSTDTSPVPRYYHASACIGTKIFTFGGKLEGGFEEHGIHILDTNYINNPHLHSPERLKEIDIEPQVMLNREESAGGWQETETSQRKQIISYILEHPPKMDSLAQLQRDDAQIMVDFLADELSRRDTFQSIADKRHILHFLTKLAKSTQTFPKSTELSDVQCILTTPVSDEGGYGFIYKGVLNKQTVCVKAVRMIGYGTRYNKMLRAQAGEAVLLAHVSHPNVIPLYGAYLSSEEVPRICIVSPWMENGDLVAYLNKFPNTSKIPLMCDTAAGLDFLHDMGIVHADLKAKNVLISRSRRAMLADFGVATILHTNVGTTTAGDYAGTDYWMAPELLVADDHPSPTKQSDMWGFACICYEMLTGEIPFRRHYHRPTQLVMAFMKGRRITPLRPKQGADPINVDGEAWVPLAERCWSMEPSERPTAAEALRFLMDLNIQDNRPSIDEELATFDAIKASRVNVYIDYSRVLSIVRMWQALEAIDHKTMMANLQRLISDIEAPIPALLLRNNECK